MQHEIRLATFNVCNLALPGMKFYDNLDPYTEEEYDARTTWIAQQIDRVDADIIAFQEIFSQAALKNALAKTQRYRDAHHVGFDPDPLAPRLTPSVALVSRLPLASDPVTHITLPHGLSIHLPGVAEPVTRFTRPILHVQIAVAAELTIQVFVTHLKSKQPDYRSQEFPSDPYHAGVATLRSLIRRGTEALGLRYLLNEHMQGPRAPLVVMGDFNDVANSVSTSLVTGSHIGTDGFSNRLFDCYRIQSRRNPSHDIGFTHLHDGIYETVDHVLVSEEFNQASPLAIGEVLEVLCLNDHVVLRRPEASDHGLVLVRIKLYEPTNESMSASYY